MVDDVLTITAAGDAIITRGLSEIDHPGHLQVRELIDNCDVATVNLETPLCGDTGYPSDRGGGLRLSTEPFAADELSQLGFNLFSVANNHIGDYLHSGMEETIDELYARDIPFSGLGQTLSDARAPGYATSANGRVALISASSTVIPGTSAGRQRISGRPGISPLTIETIYELTSDLYKKIIEISEELGLESAKNDHSDSELFNEYIENNIFPFLDITNRSRGTHLLFEKGDDTEVRQQINDRDKKEILNSIREANQRSDLVIFNLHSHEGTTGRYNHESVPAVIEDFARECIDNGADMVVSEGSHTIKGIEMYEQKPIFYGLGNFILQVETMGRYPAEMFEREGLNYDAPIAELHLDQKFSNPENWESFLPICVFNDGELAQLDLHPFTISREMSYPLQGSPFTPDEHAAQKIINRLNTLSSDYGTSIRYNSGVGKIDL